MTVLGTARVVDCRVSTVAIGGVDYLAARFDVDVLTVGALQLGPVMDAIAAKVPAGATGRVFAWPVASVVPPCAVVGYPDDPIQFDATFMRGSDRVRVPLFLLTGAAVERTARDALSAVLTGATGIKDAIDGELEEAP